MPHYATLHSSYLGVDFNTTSLLSSRRHHVDVSLERGPEVRTSVGVNTRSGRNFGPSSASHLGPMIVAPCTRRALAAGALALGSKSAAVAKGAGGLKTIVGMTAAGASLGAQFLLFGRGLLNVCWEGG